MNKDLLGLTVRDVVTGFEGMVISQTRFLAGGERIEVAVLGDDGRLVEKGWFDVLTVNVVPEEPVYRAPVPTPIVGG